MVNTSYGELVDLSALEERLSEGSRFGCLDVVTGGIPGGLDRLRCFPNCLVTPTVSGHSDGIVLLGQQAAEEVFRHFAGEPLQNEVTLERLENRA